MPDDTQTQNNTSTDNGGDNSQDRNWEAARKKLEALARQSATLAAENAGFNVNSKPVQKMIQDYLKSDPEEITTNHFKSYAKEEWEMEPPAPTSNTSESGNSESTSESGNSDTENTSNTNTGTQMDAIDHLHSSGTSGSDPTPLDTSMDALKRGDVLGSIEAKVTHFFGDPGRGIPAKLPKDQNPYVGT